MKQFSLVNMNGMVCQAIFSNPTGARVNLTSNEVNLHVSGMPGVSMSKKPATFNATATDVFMNIDGVPHRLFVDVDCELPSGLKHIWLTDGPAVIRYKSPENGKER
jgi:hypothetical protein